MVGLRLGNLYWEIGSADFLHAFFSTFSHHFEPDGFGAQFPVLMRHLYAGELSPELGPKAKDELVASRRGADESSSGSGYLGHRGCFDEAAVGLEHQPGYHEPVGVLRNR